jgi:hypothetical protein
MNKLVVADVGEAPEQVHRFDLRTGKFLPFWRGGAMPNQRVNCPPSWPLWLRRRNRNFRLAKQRAHGNRAKYPIGSQFARLLEPPYSLPGPRPHITVNRAGVIPKTRQLPLGGP